MRLLGDVSRADNEANRLRGAFFGTANTFILSSTYSNGYIQSRHFSSEARRCLSKSFRSRGVIVAGRARRQAATNIAAKIPSMIMMAG